MGTVATIIFTYLHIIMWPIEVLFYPKEIILFICMIILFLFTKRYKIKYIDIITIIGIILGIINLVGFKVIIKLLARRF